MTYYSLSTDGDGELTFWAHYPENPEHPCPIHRRSEVDSLIWTLIEEALSSGRLPSSDRPEVGNLVMYRQDDLVHYGVAIVREVDGVYRSPLEVQWYDTGEYTREQEEDLKVVER